MKQRLLSLALAAIMTLGLAAPSFAAGQTFADVPNSYWGYADIEAAAAAGLMNGTGGGAFRPETKVTVAQFLTLLGRLVFPEIKVEGEGWYVPYVNAAREAGLLTGSQVDTANVEAEISRYDMAVILSAAAGKLGVAEQSARSSEVTDYGIVPIMYEDAVLAVYGMGLIKGDQAGNFNGFSTMTRAEVATVIMRLERASDRRSTSSDGILGKWRATTDMAGMINQQFDASGMGEVLQVSSFKIAFFMELKSDNTYTLTVDKNTMADSLEGLKAEAKEGIIQYFAQTAPGVDVEEALAQNGTSIDELLDQELDLDTMAIDMDVAGQYRAEDGKLYTSTDVDEAPDDSYLSYALSGDILSLDIGNTESTASLAALLPLVFQRVHETGT